jgi:hypothetical protein
LKYSARRSNVMGWPSHVVRFDTRFPFRSECKLSRAEATCAIGRERRGCTKNHRFRRAGCTFCCDIRREAIV